MFNTHIPSTAELPSTKQLIKSTLLALVAAIVLLITVVLPAEYAIDPTGIGRVIGLTEMGEIREQLAAEAAADEQSATATAPQRAVELAPTIAEPKPTSLQPLPTMAKPSTVQEVATAQPTPPAPVWRDTTTVTLTPGQGTEIKMTMRKGEVAQFEWQSPEGPLNFDTHGEGPEGSISYKKGRGVAGEAGELTAAFDGNHGWFFRNRNPQTVTFTLNTKGSYLVLKRTK